MNIFNTYAELDEGIYIDKSNSNIYGVMDKNINTAGAIVVSKNNESCVVDDMAEASLFVLELDEETYQSNTKSMLSHINVGAGKDVTIREMAETMKEIIGFKGELTFDTTKPDGAPRKLI